MTTRADYTLPVLDVHAVQGLLDREQVSEAVPHIQTLEHFVVSRLSRIPGVRNICSSFALKQVKYQTELPLG